MPAWQAATTLANAVASVQAQCFVDWELIIVDDASTDATAQTIRTLAECDPRIRLIQLPENRGAARARNCAIRLANGRYIAFLDADDAWLPEKLHEQIGFMQKNNVALSYTGFWRETNKARKTVSVPPQVGYAELLHGNVIGCLTAVYDSHQLGKVEMPDIRLRQDYALWLKILRTIPAAHGLPQPLAVHRRRAGSLSSGALRGLFATWTLYRDIEGLGRLKSVVCLTSHIINRLQSRR